MTDITISKKDYRLLKAELALECLEAFGVDNWSGYDEAFGEDEWGNPSYDVMCKAIDEDYKD